MGLDVSSQGNDHHLLHLAIELARAPVPVHWEPLKEVDPTGAVKETVFVSSDLDVIGRKFDFLRRHDKDTMIRHVVYDGVQVMIVAQVLTLTIS